MGNVTVTITIEDKASRRELAFSAMEKAFGDARRIENTVSEWRPESQTTRLNQNAGKALVPIGHDLMTILEKAQEISEMTDGAFDITFPSKNKTVSYRDVVMLPELGLAYLRPGVTIGVSSIAKGYIVDHMSAILKKGGVRKFLVNAGDLYASGRWKVGLRDPGRPGSSDSLCELTVQDRAVSTSGDTERGPHIIDPKTHQPAPDRGSVTVIAKTSTMASPMATGFFVLGKEKAEKILAEKHNFSAVFIENGGEKKGGKDGKIDALNPSRGRTFRCRPF